MSISGVKYLLIHIQIRMEERKENTTTLKAYACTGVCIYEDVRSCMGMHTHTHTHTHTHARTHYILVYRYIKKTSVL